MSHIQLAHSRESELFLISGKKSSLLDHISKFSLYPLAKGALQMLITIYDCNNFYPYFSYNHYYYCQIKNKNEITCSTSYNGPLWVRNLNVECIMTKTHEPWNSFDWKPIELHHRLQQVHYCWVLQRFTIATCLSLIRSLFCLPFFIFPVISVVFDWPLNLNVLLH